MAALSWQTCIACRFVLEQHFDMKCSLQLLRSVVEKLLHSLQVAS